MSMWKTIDTAPPDTELLLFCPERHFTNRERIEVGVASNSRAGTSHAWATHWAYLPTGPDPEEVARILADEDEQEYRAREMDHLAHEGQL